MYIGKREGLMKYDMYMTHVFMLLLLMLLLLP